MHENGSFSEKSTVQKFAITLEIDTGNIIYEEFEDIEELLEFVQKYGRDSKAILDRITPKKRID